MIRRMKSLLHYLRVLPPIPSIVLYHRRFRKVCQVTRVLKSRRAVERYYRLNLPTAPRAGDLMNLRGGRVIAQPVAVLGPDYALLWGFSPQLQRRPTTSSTFWKKLGNPRFLPGRSFFAAVDGFSYYHWLFGTLPKLLLAQKSPQCEQILVNPRHKGQINFQTESLELLGISANRIIWIDRGMHWHCEELILPPNPCTHHQTRLTPWAYQLLLALFLPQIEKLTLPNLPENLYITRAQARRRRLINESEVAAALQQDGYTPIVLESLPLLHQIKYLSSARRVVGLHGAGLANIVFCRPGTQVVEITSNLWSNPCFKYLAKQCQLDYTPVAGRGISGERVGFAADVQVDVQELIAATSSLARQKGDQDYRVPR